MSIISESKTKLSFFGYLKRLLLLILSFEVVVTSIMIYFVKIAFNDTRELLKRF